MKILISAAYYAPHISGLTNSIKNVAELLAKNGYVVHVITAQHKKSLPREETINHVQVFRVPFILRLSKGFLMPGWWYAVYKEVKSSDHVLINLPQFEGCIVALIAKLLRKKVHSIYICDVTMSGSLTNNIVVRMLQWSNNLSLSLSNDVITLTKDYKNFSKTLRSITKPIHIIPPVILEPKILSSSKQSLQQRFPDLQKKYIGFVGRLASEKGIEYVFEAIPRIQALLNKPFAIVLAGPEQVVGERAYQKRIQGYLNKYKDHIITIGELKDSELGAFYSMLDVLVLPSINPTEVFGMVQVEAMYCGTPVVSSNLPGVRTIVQQTGMGEVAKMKNSKDFADKLVQVIKYKKSYIKSKEALHKIYSTQKVLEAYQSILQ